MREAHGTSRLITDYGAWPESAGKSGNTRSSSQNQTDDPASIRNSEDYDDWEYGTEPIPHDHTWTRRRSS